jgi:Pyruvate dehydrogenase complex, dehydrogenase (E1) component
MAYYKKLWMRQLMENIKIYKAKGGKYPRENFFGKNPKVL